MPPIYLQFFQISSWQITCNEEEDNWMGFNLFIEKQSGRFHTVAHCLFHNKTVRKKITRVTPADPRYPCSHVRKFSKLTLYWPSSVFVDFWDTTYLKIGSLLLPTPSRGNHRIFFNYPFIFRNHNFDQAFPFGETLVTKRLNTPKYIKWRMKRCRTNHTLKYVIQRQKEYTPSLTCHLC